MRFMSLKPFYYAGILHEAAPDAPKIFDFPSDEVPSITWRPLDTEAHEALIVRAAEILERTTVKDLNGNVISPGTRYRVFGIPKEFQEQEVVVKAEKLKAPVKTDPDELPAITADVIAAKEPSKIPNLKKAIRVSDQEP